MTMDNELALMVSSLLNCASSRRECRQVQVVHHHDLPLSGILRYHKFNNP